MKKINRYALLIWMLMFLLGFTSANAEVISLTDGSNQAEMPFVLVLPSGDVLVMYNHGEGFGIDAVLKYTILSKTTGNWSSAKTAVPRIRSSAFAQLALDKHGIVHMAYFDGDASANRDIYYATYNPVEDKWSGKKLVYESPGVNSSWHRIRVEDDKIYIVWTHNYDPADGLTDVVMVVNDIGGSWPVPSANRITVSHTGQSGSAHNMFDVKDKNVYVTWIDDDHSPDNWAIYYNEGIYDEGSGTWNFNTTPEYPFQWGANQYYPALVCDDTGTPHIIFSHKNGPFFRTRRAGNSFTAPVAISLNTCAFNLIAFAIFKQGLIHTAWVESTSNGESMFYGRGLPDGTWAPSVKIGDGQIPGYPAIDVDNEGTVYVAWSDGPNDERRNIKFASVDLPGTPPTASLVASSPSGAIPFTVKFDASGSTDSDGNIINYSWDFGDGSSAKVARVSHTYTQIGTYTVLLSVMDNDLRVGTAQKDIVVSLGNPVAKIDLSADTGVAPFIVTCDGSGSTDADGSIVSYAWNFGDGTTGTGESVSHAYQTGGTYTVSLTVTDNEGYADTATKSLVVFEKPSANFTVSSNYGRQPLEVTFNASTSSDPDGNIVSYVWDFGDDLTGQGQTIVHTYFPDGEFLAFLTVTDDDGVTDTASNTITVIQVPAVPLNVAVEILENKSFMRTEYINRVSWVENPKRVGMFPIASYRIYRKAKNASADQYVMVRELSPDTLWSFDRGFTSLQDVQNYDYAVTSVDNQGQESAFANTTGTGFLNDLLARIKKRLNF